MRRGGGRKGERLNRKNRNNGGSWSGERSGGSCIEVVRKMDREIVFGSRETVSVEVGKIIMEISDLVVIEGVNGGRVGEIVVAGEGVTGEGTIVDIVLGVVEGLIRAVFNNEVTKLEQRLALLNGRQ